MTPPTRSTSRRPSGRRSLRRALLAFAAAASAVPAVLVSTSVPATAASAGLVTVTETTGLDPAGDTVTVVGGGYADGDGVYVRFCSAPSGEIGTNVDVRPTAAECDADGDRWVGNQPGATDPMTDGGFSVSLPVSGTVGDPAVDCTEPDACGVFVRRDHNGGGGDTSLDEWVPLSFATDSASPTVVVTPSTGLDPAGDTVTVDGSGFTASGVYAMFCQRVGVSGEAGGRPTGADCSGEQAWVTGSPIPGTTPWSGDGTFTLELDVVSAFGAVDCTAAGTECGIVTRTDHTAPQDFSQDTFTPVTFATDEQPVGLVTVDPTTGLDAAGDVVRVEGSGYADGVGVYVRLCTAPQGAVGTAAGRPGAEDCDGQGVWANPTVPGPNTAPMVDGAFTADLPVAGAFATTAAHDCMTAGSCGVFVRRDHSGAEDFSYDEWFPLTFDPSTTPPDVEPEQPSLNDVVLSLSKSEGVADGEAVTANGEGYQPDQGIYLQWCARPEGQLGTAAGRTADCYPGQDGTHTVWQTPIPADGTFSVPITAERTFTTEAGDEIDCTDPGACGVFTRRDHNGGATDYSQDAFAPVTFGDGTAPETDPASLNADRVDGLDPSGDTITVTGSNFRPGVDLFVALCSTSDATDCDYDNLVEVTPSAGDVTPTDPIEDGDTSVLAAVASPGDPGWFQAELDVVGSFGSTVCGTDGCEVRTWAVSLSEARDEVALPVSFAAGSGSGGFGDGSAGGDSSRSGSLPATGADSRRPVVVGMGLLGLGLALTLVGRRRETA